MLMQAVLAERPGILSDVLALHNIPDPGVPGEGEVTVRMIASTINPSDAVTVSGAYGSRTQFPFIPGFEKVSGLSKASGRAVPLRLWENEYSRLVLLETGKKSN